MPVVPLSPMAREKRNDIAVKVAEHIYRMAKLIAAHRDIPLAQYLSELLEKPVARDFEKLKEDLDAGRTGD